LNLLLNYLTFYLWEKYSNATR